MKNKKSIGAILGNVVRKAVKWTLGLVAGVALTYGAALFTFYTGRGDRLTSEETQLVNDLYGDRVDAGKIRKHLKGEKHITHVYHGKVGTVPPPTSHIDFFGRDSWSKNYALEDDPVKFGRFVHETEHVDQNQNREWRVKTFLYGFALDEKARFDDFSIEQRGEIVQAYAVYYFHASHAESEHCTATTADGKKTFYENLKRVVEEKFPQAKITRERIESGAQKPYGSGFETKAPESVRMPLTVRKYSRSPASLDLARYAFGIACAPGRPSASPSTSLPPRPATGPNP